MQNICKGINTTKHGRILNVPRKPYIHTHPKKGGGEGEEGFSVLFDDDSWNCLF